MMVIITGGGTGGHLKVANALIEELNKRGIQTVFIGSKNGQDKQWFENDKRLKKAFFLNTKGVVNKSGLNKIFSIFQILKNVSKCLSIISNYKAQSLISVGGFSAAPATFASILSLKCKLYIHEQNSVMGRLNALTARFAKDVFCSFDSSSKIKDYPVLDDFFDKARIRDSFKNVIFLGGSQGATEINNFAIKVAPELYKLGLKIIHQTGKSDFQRVVKKYEQLGIKVDVFPFVKNISQKMNKADFAISRAGASTLWELCANALPTLFVPFPYAAKDHQYKNARFLKDKGLCHLLRQEELAQSKLIDILKKDNHSISKKLANTTRRNGTKFIIDYILENSK